MQVIRSLPQHSKSCWAWLRSNIGGWNERMNCLITMTREDWAWSTLAFYLNHSHGNAVDNAHIVHSVSLVSKTAQYKLHSKILYLCIKGVWDTGSISSGLLAIPAYRYPRMKIIMIYWLLYAQKTCSHIFLIEMLSFYISWKNSCVSLSVCIDILSRRAMYFYLGVN